MIDKQWYTPIPLHPGSQTGQLVRPHRSLTHSTGFCYVLYNLSRQLWETEIEEMETSHGTECSPSHCHMVLMRDEPSRRDEHKHRLRRVPATSQPAPGLGAHAGRRETAWLWVAGEWCSAISFESL